MDVYSVDSSGCCLLLAHRERADEGRLAVQVEDKLVRVKHVKVSILGVKMSQLLYYISNIVIICVSFVGSTG